MNLKTARKAASGIPEERFQTIFAQSPVSTQIFSPDGTLLQVNKAWEKLWGVTFSSVLDYNILHDRQLEALGIMPLVKKALQGETISFPPVRYEPNKSIAYKSTVTYRWTKSMMYPVTNETGVLEEIVLVHEDITEQKEAEDHFRQSEERYRTFITQSSEGIWRFELEKPIDTSLPVRVQLRYMYKYGYLAECNDSMAKMYGFTKANEIVGARLGDFLIESDRQNIAYLTAFVKSKYRLSSVESHEKDKEGNNKYFSNSLVGILDGNAVVRAWGTQVDVTKQKIAEEELKRSSDQLHIILQGVADGISMQDATGKLQYINDAGAKIAGFKSAREMMSGKVPIQLKEFEMVDENNEPFLFDNLPGRRALRGEKTPDAIIGYRDKKTNESQWSVVKARPIFGPDKTVQYAINIFHDITRIRQAETSLRESEELFRQLVETTNVIPWESDVATGRFTYVGPQAEKMLGYKIKHWYGADFWYAHIHPDDRDWVFAYCLESCKSKDQYEFEYRMLDMHHNPLWFRDVVSVIRVNGKPKTLRGFMIDITQQKNLEKQKDEFIGIASHELKTPVTSLKAYAQVLQNRFSQSGEEDSAVLLSKMDQQFDKLTNLIADLLDVTKIETGKLQFHEDWFDFNELVSEIVEEVARTTTRHVISQKLDITKSLYGDRDRIGQVLVNLLSNAIKYSPRSESIIVRTKITKNVLTVSVQDFGEGISKSAQKKVFERFYRETGSRRETFPGLGLGLYISSEIIKRHKGKIWVESAHGNKSSLQGSTFYFSLPIKQKEH